MNVIHFSESTIINNFSVINLLTIFKKIQVYEKLNIPSFGDCKHFINLTNGIEALKVFNKYRLDYRFVLAIVQYMYI